jgi:hypothetical protein
MLGRLIVVAGPDQGTVFVLAEGAPFLIGRSHATATQLSDPWVSRTHCRIDSDRGMLRLTDVGSKRGTFVNGQRIFDCELRSGDAIRIGTTEFRFQGESAESPAASRRSGQAAPESVVEEAIPLGDLVGRNVAHIAVRCNLATGATGIVFLGADLGRDRTVALKVFWPTTCRDEEQTQKLLYLMRSVASVEHPNIVQVYEADKTGPYCWVSMELVEGENLGKVIRRIEGGQMLDWRYAYRVAVQVARAIQAAHARGIVHRNITPSNILVRASDQFVKLGDFTLGKLLSSVGASNVSQAGELTGDVFYMSPERTDQTRDADARSDLYSLGATVYALLSGRPPCDGETLTEVIDRIRYARPEDPKKFQSDLPDDFAQIVLKMLEKQRADRYQTSDALLADLERVGEYQRVAI